MTSCNIIIILVLTTNLLWGLQLNLDFHCFHFKLYTTKLLFIIMRLNRNTKYFHCKTLQCQMHIFVYLPKTLYYFSFALSVSRAVNEVNKNKFKEKKRHQKPLPPTPRARQKVIIQPHPHKQCS